jgi:hypothetical protein
MPLQVVNLENVAGLADGRQPEEREWVTRQCQCTIAVGGGVPWRGIKDDPVVLQCRRQSDHDVHDEEDPYGLVHGLHEVVSGGALILWG